MKLPIGRACRQLDTTTVVTLWADPMR